MARRRSSLSTCRDGCWQSFRAVRGGAYCLFCFGFLFISFGFVCPLANSAAPGIREIYEYRRMGETTRAMAPEGLGWSGLSPHAEDANSPSNWPNMTSNAGRYSSGKPVRQFSVKKRSANEVTSCAPFAVTTRRNLPRRLLRISSNKSTSYPRRLRSFDRNATNNDCPSTPDIGP